METTTRLLLPEVREALETHPEQLEDLIEEMHPADLADLASELEPGHAQKLLSLIPVATVARILEFCGAEKRAELFEHLVQMSVDNAADITDEMAPDDRADLFAELSEDMQRQLLEAVDEQESHDIRQLLAYPEDTAGALMTTDFVGLSPTMTVSAAIDSVRQTAREMETIYQAYAVDPHGKLLGVVSLRDLVTSAANASVDSIMNPNVVSADVDADQEEVARLIKKYDLLALPVVDRAHSLFGIITVDDIMDVVEEEATEDVHKMGAIDPLESPYMATPMRELFRARAPWLILLFAAVLLTENVLEHYHAAELAVLAWFVPVIISSGGNAGSQSATLIIRAMAVGGVEPRHAFHVLRRELALGVLLGVLLALLGLGRIAITESTRSLEMAGAIGLSLLAVVTFGAFIGSGIPLLLRRLGIDPAVSSTPFIASMVDIVGLVIYYEISIGILT